MKALLYKDFCVLWKQMKFVIALVVILCTIPNSALNLNLFFVVYAGLLIPATLFAYDERDRWNALAAMLPYSIRTLVLSRYVFGWLFTGLAVLCNLAGKTLAAGGRPPADDDLLALLMTLTITLVVQAVYFPILFRLGPERGRLLMLMLLVGVMVTVGLSAELLRGVRLGSPMHLAVPALLAAVLLCLASVKAAQRQYARRVW